MALESHSDYFQYSWECLVTPSSVGVSMTTRLAGLLAMFLTVVGISSFVYLAFDLGQAELVWLILCASVVYVVTAVVFWTQFGGAGSKPRIYSYQINHDGVWVEGKLTPFAQINTAKVKIFLSSMEYSSQPVLQLTLPLNSLGTLKLHFPDEATHKRVMAALKNYIGTL